jgi:REP element-mobilizing transposase RayT
MPRKSRIDAPGALHHIICRGIEQRPIFEGDFDPDRFVERLGAILQETATPCYAWALIPNHFHLLIRTGLVPVATVMRRLLSGYAVSFNHRHHRNGHLFQNRYKSILCQEDPLSAGTGSLHSFESNPRGAGGGLIRSSGGWHVLKEFRRIGIHFKSDERLLGDSNFVDMVLKAAGETLNRKYRIQAEGWDFEAVVSRVCRLFKLTRSEVLSGSKQRKRAAARSVLAYWSVKELGMSASAVA